MNVLKEKIMSGKRLCGTHVSMSEPTMCEVIGHLGFDFIWVDMEHSYLSCQDVLIHANAGRAAGTPVIVRVPQHDLTYTKKIMEMGVDGIIFPMIEDAKDMEKWLSMTLYPPYGKRGYGPLRAVRYGLDPSDEYINQGHIQNICRFIQIERISAVEDIEAIASNPYLDGIFFGPFDLSGSINQLGNLYGDDVTALIRRTVEIMKKHNKAIGISIGTTDEKELRHWQDLGIQILSVASDYGYILSGASDVLNKLHTIQAE